MWDTILNWVKDTLLRFIGPPDVDNEPKFKAWVTRALKIMDSIAVRTRTEVDDQVVDGLQDVVEDPGKWSLVYPLLVTLFGDGTVTIGSDLGKRADVAEVAGKVGLDLGLFVQILLAVLRLLGK